MKLDLSDRKTQVMIGMGLLVLLLVIILIFVRWPKRSKYTISDNVYGGTTADGAFQVDVTTCQATFNANQDQTMYNTCLQTAMTNLINRRCPYVAGNAPGSGDPNSANWTAYQADLTTISNQYNNLIQAAPDSTVTSAGPSGVAASSFSLQGYVPSQGMVVSPTSVTPYGNGPELNFTVSGATGIQVGQTIAGFTVAGGTASTVTVVYVDPSNGTNVTLKWPNNTTQFTVPANTTAVVTGGPYTFAAGSLAAGPPSLSYTYANGTVTTSSGHNLQPGIMTVTFPGKIGPFVVQTTPTSTTFTITVPAGVTIPTSPTASPYYAVDVLSKQILRAARKADITGATRKYLALSCSGFYKAGTTGYIDPTCAYAGWTSSASLTSQYGFRASSVTPQSVLAWAKYASNVDATGPLLPNSGTTLYNTSVTDSLLGSQTYAQYTQNYGPGTILNASTANTAASISPATPVGSAAYTCGTSSGLQTLPSTIYTAQNGWV